MKRTRKIILADDDPLLRELATTKLREAGYDVEAVQNGSEALRHLLAHGADMVISDISMPVMDGYELTEKIRSTREIREVPIIVITASDSGEAVDRAFAAGATSFLAKPINWPLFHQAVKFVLRAYDDRRALLVARDQAEAGLKFKDGLLSVMTHELRTPLNAIIGFGQIISDHCGKENDNLHREYAEYIVDGGRRLLNSVSDMLLASEARSGPLTLNDKETTLGAVVDAALSGLQKRLEQAGAKPVLKLCSRDLEMRCDGAMMAAALRKLIENTLKFCPKGFQLVIGAAETRNGGLAIMIKDNGPGMNAQQIASAAIPFAQLNLSSRRSREGLCLGLPLVHAIAGAHGGAVRLDSKPGEGVRALIILPPSRVIRSAVSKRAAGGGAAA